MTAKKTIVLDGRTWTVEYCGPTKYGRRAKLVCGSETKWVNASVVEGGTQKTTARPKRRVSEENRCEVCGGNMYTCGHCVGW